jgi:hypothetical protein
VGLQLHAHTQPAMKATRVLVAVINARGIGGTDRVERYSMRMQHIERGDPVQAHGVRTVPGPCIGPRDQLGRLLLLASRPHKS